jgi:multidrug efflux system outer membrane protein
MAAANARIGMARAAFFPRLSLTGALGYESNELGDLFKWSSRAFVMGPLVGTLLSLPIFDGGARQAGVDQAHAVYAEEAANYQQTVLQSLQGSRGQPGHCACSATRRRLKTKRSVRHGAPPGCRRSSTAKVRSATSTSSMPTAACCSSSAWPSSLMAERARATVNLIRAIGGGWNAPSVN